MPAGLTGRCRCFLLRENQDPDYVLTLDCVMYYLEIPKIPLDEENPLVRWLYYLRNAGKEENEIMKVLLCKDSVLREADRR